MNVKQELATFGTNTYTYKDAMCSCVPQLHIKCRVATRLADAILAMAEKCS